jgi:septum site-determining protein MinC
LRRIPSGTGGIIDLKAYEGGCNMEIKGDSKRGLRLVAEGFANELDLISDLETTLKQRRAFLGSAALDVQIQDLPLTSDLVTKIAAVFDQYPELSLSGILRDTPRPEPIPLARRLEPALVIRHTLRSGQHQYHQGDLIIIGDVNPGATVAAAGDILIFGRLRGNAHAGQPQDLSKGVYALTFTPTQVRIGPLLAIGESSGREPEFAHVESGQVVVEPWSDVRLPDVVTEDSKSRSPKVAHPSSS